MDAMAVLFSYAAGCLLGPLQANYFGCYVCWVCCAAAPRSMGACSPSDGCPRLLVAVSPPLRR